MNEEFTSKISIEVVDTGLRELIQLVSKLDDELNGANPAVARLAKSLSGLRGDFSGSSSSTRESTKAAKENAAAVGEETDAWKELVKALKAANKATTEFKRGQLTGEGGGTDPNQLDRAQRDQYIAINSAKSSSVADFKSVNSAEDKAAAYLRALSEIESKRTWLQEKQDIGELAAAQNRVNRAQEEYNKATRSVSSANSSGQDAKTIADAIGRQVAAKRNLLAAEQNLSGVQSRAAAQQARDEARAQRDLEQTIARTNRYKETISSVSAANAWDKQVRELGAVEAATRRAQAATERLVAAERASASADASGDAKKIEAAYQEQANAATEARNATVALERAQRFATTATADLADTASPRLRYALYDVATTATITSAALIAAGSSAVVMSAQQESALAKVQQVSQANTQQASLLRNQLTQLSTLMPTSFSDLAAIESLGAQLGLAKSELAGFAQIVSQYSTVTGEASSTVAEGFGRIGQLLDVSVGQYNNLGSAILAAGNSSIATEADVLSYTERLAIAGAQAGLTASQTIALSSTLASLGTGSEASQGAIQRIFQKITIATQTGGEELDAFATRAGMSAEQFASSWRTSPQEAFSALLTGLSTVQDKAVEFKNIGFSDTRDIRVLTALTNNLDLYSSQLEIANGAYQNGTYLAQSYAIQLDTLSSRWQLLVNAIQNFAAQVGEAVGPVVKEILKDLAAYVNEWTRALNTPAGQWFAVAALAAMALVAALTGVVGMLTLGAASYLAITLAAQTYAETSASGFARVVGGMFGVKAATDAATASTVELTIATEAQNAASAGATTSIGAAERGTTGLSRAMGALGGTVATAGIALGALVMVNGVRAMMEQSASSAQQAENAFNELIGTTSGLAEAVQSDTAAATAAMAEGNASLAGSYTKVSDAAASAADLNGEVAGRIGRTAEVLGLATNATKDNAAATRASTYYLGANTTAWIKQQLLKNEAFQSLASDQTFYNYWIATGANMDTFIQIAYAKGSAAAQSYVNGLASGKNVQQGDGGSFFQGVYNWLSESKDVVKQVLDWTGTISQAVSLPTMGTGIASLFSGNISSSMGASWSNTFYQGLISSAKDVGIIHDTAAESIAKMANAAAGVGQELSLVDLTTQNATTSLTDFNDGLTDTSNSAADATAEIRTLVDYADDLSGVFGRSFDLNFGNEQALDKITSGWASIAAANQSAVEKIADYNDKIAEIQATMNELTADRSQKEYWLSVAEQYGDIQRAIKLRAELSKIDQQLQSKQSDMAKTGVELSSAQESASMSLDGNTDAAIKNRSTLLEMIQAYQSYLVSLASTGMSQADLYLKTASLKAQFVQQATQLGFNTSQVDSYASAFDDLGTIIRYLPRNVSIEANTNQAITALQEFIAKANQATNNGAGYNIPITSSYDNAAAVRALEDQYRIAQAYMAQLRGSGNTSGAVRYSDTVSSIYGKLVETRGWATGGYTGDGGMYDVAGLVHKGEFVFSKAATQNIGVANLAYMHEMGMRGGAGGVAGSSGAANGPIDLSASTIYALSQALSENLNLTIGGQTISSAVSSYNERATARRSG